MLLIDSWLSLLSCFPQYMLLNAKIATETSGARQHDIQKGIVRIIDNTTDKVMSKVEAGKTPNGIMFKQ